MTAQTIGQAKIRIRPVFEKRDLDEQVDRATAGGGKVRISADTAEAKAKVDELRVRLDTFGQKVATAKIDLDGDRRAQDRLTRLEFQLRRVGLTTARPNVDLQGVARANLQLDELEARLALVDRAGSGVGGGGGGRRLAGGSGSGGPFRSGGFFNPGALGTGIALAAPAAIPLGAVGLGVGAGAFAAAGAALPGLAAFGIGAKSSVTAVQSDVTKLTKLTQQYNAAATDKQRAAVLAKEHQLWSSLDPAQRRAVKNVDALDASWARYKKRLEPQTFAVLADGSKIAATGLKYILPAAQAVGDELDDMAKRAEHAFKAPFWHQFFGDFLPGEAARATDAFGTAIGNLLTAGAHLVQDFAPLGHDFEGGLVRLSGRFESWTEGAGPGKFVAYVEKEGPQVARTLGALAHGLEGVGKGLAPIGQVELAALTPVLEFIGKLGNEHPEVLTAIGAGYLSIAVGLKAVAAVKGLGAIAGVLTGGRVGGGGALGGGGILGKGTPVPVYVTNWEGGRFGGAATKTATTTAEQEAAGRGGRSVGIRVAEKLGLRVATAGAAATALTLAAPITDVALLATRDSGQKLPPLSSRHDAFSQLYNVLDPKGRKEFPQSTIHGGRVDLNQAVTFLATTGSPAQVAQLQQLAKMYPQIAVALKGIKEASDRANDSLDREKSSVALLRAQFATLGPQVERSLTALGHTPRYLRDAQAAALNGGTVIGRNLADGITIGLRQGDGKVQVTAVSVVKGALSAMSKTARMDSPSKVTTQYGRWIAEGLAVGFTGYSSTLIKSFSVGTQNALNAVGMQVNNATAQLRSDLAGRAQLSGSISSGLLGAADISQLATSNTGGGSIRDHNAYEIGQLKTLSREEALLRKRGLNSTYLQQIAAAGPERGVFLAEDILSGREGSIKGLNTQVMALSRYAGSVGSTVAGATYAGTVARDERNLGRAVTALERMLTKKLDLSAHSEALMERAFEQALHRAFPSLNIRDLGKAGATKIRTAR